MHLAQEGFTSCHGVLDDLLQLPTSVIPHQTRRLEQSSCSLL